MSFHPKLLVSVRDCQEALAAHSGGADIIDLKEPNFGSLGMAPVQMITDVLEWKTSNNITLPISAALGELAEWDTHDSTIPNGLSYVKVGLAGESSVRFQKRLNAFQLRLESLWDSKPNSFSGNTPQWVTVAYADQANANCPSILEIARHAMESESAGLLVDTFSKTGMPLSEYVSVQLLADLRAMLNENGQFFAIAGQIQPDQIDRLSGIQPDIVAVRSAVCIDGNRQQQVDCQAVVRIKHLLNTNR